MGRRRRGGARAPVDRRCTVSRAASRSSATTTTVRVLLLLLLLLCPSVRSSVRLFPLSLSSLSHCLSAASPRARASIYRILYRHRVVVRRSIDRYIVHTCHSARRFFRLLLTTFSFYLTPISRASELAHRPSACIIHGWIRGQTSRSRGRRRRGGRLTPDTEKRHR